MDQLFRLVDELGLHVVEAPGRTRGGFTPASATIRLAPGMTARTARSVLAHEVAHAVLGHRPTEQHDERARQEREADDWAARLLITPEAYSSAESLCGPHLAPLAFELGVTVEIVAAFRRRMLRLGDAVYLDPRLGRGQWEHRSTAA